jgi:hypothetical protein
MWALGFRLSDQSFGGGYGQIGGHRRFEPVTMAREPHVCPRLPLAESAIRLQPWKPFAVGDKFLCFDQQRPGRDGVFKPAMDRSVCRVDVLADGGCEDGEPVGPRLRRLQRGRAHSFAVRPEWAR